MPTNHYDPRQARDTNGRWVRIGRGDLEALVHKAAGKRAEDIARTNGKGGNQEHIDKVAGDIRRKALKDVPVAPQYVVKVHNPADRPRFDVDVAARGKVMRVKVPENKRYGNVEVIKRNIPPPNESKVVNKAEFGVEDAGPKTADVKKRLQEALPTGVQLSHGLTDAAAKAAKKGRKRKKDDVQLFNRTDPVSPTHAKREVEAAIAAKRMKKAQGDRVRSVISRRPPSPAANRDMVEWAQSRLGGRLSKPERLAMEAFRDFLERDSAAGFTGDIKAVGRRDVSKVPGLASAALPAAKLDNRHHKAMVDALAKLTPEERKGWLQAANRVAPADQAEGALEYVRRVRKGLMHGELGVEARRQLDVVRKVRAAVNEAAVPAPVKAKPAQKSGPKLTPSAVAGLPQREQELYGEITELKRMKNGGINETFRGKLKGKPVYVKPAEGAFDQGGGAAHGRQGMVARLNVPRGKDNEHERAAYLVIEQLHGAMPEGFAAPTVVIRNVPGKGQCSVQSSVGKQTAMDAGVMLHKGGNFDPAGARRIAFLDAITGNTDRHHGNVQVDVNEKKAWPIDNGLAWPNAKGDPGNHQVIRSYYGTELKQQEVEALERLLLPGGALQKIEGEGLLEPAQLEMARKRIRYMIRNRKFIPNGQGEGLN